MAHTRGSTPRPCIALYQKGISSTTETIMLNVMTAFKTARDEILSSYDKSTLRDIANYGCESGCASEHIYYSQTDAFFKRHEDEIEDYLAISLGEDWLQQISSDPTKVAGIQTLINQIVWVYVEAIAHEAISHD